MTQISPIFKREFFGYFRSPVAYVFLVVFSVASIGLAFFVGGFFKANQATMQGYFTFYPWLFLFLIPAAFWLIRPKRKTAGEAPKTAE